LEVTCLPAGRDNRKRRWKRPLFGLGNRGLGGQGGWARKTSRGPVVLAAVQRWVAVSWWCFRSSSIFFMTNILKPGLLRGKMESLVRGWVRWVVVWWCESSIVVKVTPHVVRSSPTRRLLVRAS
jgi:hypothetical protein